VPLAGLAFGIDLTLSASLRVAGFILIAASLVVAPFG
jgi:hypothetical protein